MDYIYPDEETLARHLCLLSKVLVHARCRAYETDKQMAELPDAVHNVPRLPARWPDMEEEWVLADLEEYEAKYCGGNNPFSGVLKNGVDPNWQLKWPPDEAGA